MKSDMAKSLITFLNITQPKNREELEEALENFTYLSACFLTDADRLLPSEQLTESLNAVIFNALTLLIEGNKNGIQH